MAEIALIASSYFPRIGGVEEHVRHVARELKARGVDVVVWTVDRGDVVPDEIDGIPVRALPCPLPARTPGAILSFLWRAPLAALRWASAFRRDRPRVLHVHCFGPNGVWARFAARLTRTRLVITGHGETFGDADGVFAESALLRGSLRGALADADAVTACSAFTLRDLESRFGLAPGRGVVIMNGVDVDEPTGEPPVGLPQRYILAMGRVVETKGFDLLLRGFAAATLPDDLHLVIGGIGPAVEDLRTLADELGIADRVILTGRLDRGAVVATAAGAMALVMPSRVEPFGIVLLEGWRAGVPVIATTHGGPVEIVHDGEDGWLVDPFDTPALASALTRIVDEPATASRVAAAGEARVEDFTWSRIAEQYETLYDLLPH